VSADGQGLVSQGGAVLLWETIRVTGLDRGLSDAALGLAAIAGRFADGTWPRSSTT
jgi:hypothetical protein